jgi:signal recognition particle subunit SRP54
MGEKVDALEPFHPERVASRILGMGDVLSLVEQVQAQVDREKADKLAKKIQKGKGFDFNDLRDQMQQLEQMGGVNALLDKLPGGLAAAAKAPNAGQMAGKEVRRQIALINSMTAAERRNPDLIDASRKRRIARGSGLQVQDVNRLMKQQMQMQQMMKQFSKLGMRGLMRSLGGRLPPGFGG